MFPTHVSLSGNIYKTGIVFKEFNILENDPELDPILWTSEIGSLFVP